MKSLKYISLIFIFYFQSTIFNCQAQWTQLNPGTSNWLNDIDCPTDDTCYVVGNSGVVLLTTDGGVNFNVVDSGINKSESYFAVDCINSLTCWIGHGNDGIYRTSNGAISWITTAVPVGFGGIPKLFMVDDSVGYVPRGGGGDYLKTIDGSNWSWESTFMPSDVNISVYFVNKDTGYFGTNTGKILKTINGGSSWTEYTISGCNLQDIFFINDTVGYTVGMNGCVYRTTNKGATWDTLNSGVSNNLRSIHCTSIDTCYIVGDAGLVLETTDTGNTWIRDTAGVPSNNLTTVFFPSSTVGYAVGSAGTVIKKDFTIGIQDTRHTIVKANVYPNPFKEQAVILYQEDDSANFELYDIVGKKQLTVQLQKGINTLHPDKLTKGIYIYQIKGNKEIISTGKLIIQ